MHLLVIMLAAALVLGGCRTTGAVPKPFPGAAVVAKAPAPPEAATPDAAAPSAPMASASAPSDAEELRPDKPASAPVDPEERRRDRPRDFGDAIAQLALGFRGVPYRLGGADPDGFDCSGLVHYVFAQYGIGVPRIVEEQYEVGAKVRPRDLEPGDLIFFNTKTRGRGVSHVAIALGNHSFVHAPNSTGVVRVETLDSSYWGARYVGARRINASSTSN
jgi:cell wall-associated NlpC family hydrolase